VVRKQSAEQPGRAERGETVSDEEMRAWSAHAVADLETISGYIQQDRSLETANRGRAGRIANTRELVLPRLPYLVVYRVDEDRVLILNIVHGARRWPLIRVHSCSFVALIASRLPFPI
jgi:toxin ParE1/3/4